MASFSEAYIKSVRRYLPLPFTIAVLLTCLTFILALLLTGGGSENKVVQISESWYQGLTHGPYLAFTLQMILILVLGHIIAKSRSFNAIISRLVSVCKDTPSAAAIVTFATLSVALVNWGLGLIFGAILARKVAEYASANHIKLNYPLIGAAGYSGLMIWHAGLSGSAPLVVATPDHFLIERMGIVGTDETLFSSMNITVILFSLIALPMLMYFLGKRYRSESTDLSKSLITDVSNEEKGAGTGIKIDRSPYLSYLFGGAMIAFAFYLAIIKPKSLNLEFLNLNFIILALFGFAILLNRGFVNFISSSNDAIKGASGILIQFPLYFGILGIMKGSGLIEVFSDFLIQYSAIIPLEINTYISAALVNIFVPSGGGQWAVQGPIVIEAADTYGLKYSKAIMALAYGDQLTNMLQPFWALPLLAITGLKAKDILPYTFILFLAGAIIFASALLIF